MVGAVEKDKTMTQKEMEAAIAKLQAENEALKQKVNTGGTLTLRVSEKGGVSLYGMGKFPVTLYAEQWGRVFAHGQQIIDFINANVGKLSTKADSLIRKAAEKAAAGPAAPTTGQPATAGTMAFGSLNLPLGKK